MFLIISILFQKQPDFESTWLITAWDPNINIFTRPITTILNTQYTVNKFDPQTLNSIIEKRNYLLPGNGILGLFAD